MGKSYIDLSLTIVPSGEFSMIPRGEIWGQEEVATSIVSISKPDEWPMHKFEMSTESFTHVHVPSNLYRDGWTNEKVPTELFFGEAVVFDMSHKRELEPVTAADLEATGVDIRPGDMAIVRTDWSDKYWGTAKFWVEMPYLGEDGCEWLLKGIKAYVSDTYNDSPLAKYGDSGRLEPTRLGSPTHYKFLKANVILVEYVTNLSALTKSRVELVCLPLKPSGVGQAPARVVAIEMIDTNEARFDAVAAAYEKNVTPLFQQPAADLIELVALQSGERVLDAGTGPGSAALLAASKVAPTGSVVAVDLSEGMLSIARQKAASQGLSVEFVRGDVEALEFPEGSFDVVISNCGLGTTDPARSLPSIRRVLKPGGRFVMAHWGPSSKPAQAFYELLQKRRVSEVTPRLEWLRQTDLMARPWSSEYQTPEALAAGLTGYGFQNVRTSAREYVFTYASSDAYLDMSMSFPLAQAEFQALSPGNQRMFRHEFNAAMAPFRGPNRSIISVDTILFALADN